MKPVCVFAVLALTYGLTAPAQTRAPEIPLVSGLTFVLAVHNPLPEKAGSNIAQGDYELVVTVGAVDATGVTFSTSIDAFDEAKKPLQLNITRRISRTDLAGAREQILGFLRLRSRDAQAGIEARLDGDRRHDETPARVANRD
jgi:hypothetical protein